MKLARWLGSLLNGIVDIIANPWESLYTGPRCIECRARTSGRFPTCYQCGMKKPRR